MGYDTFNEAMKDFVRQANSKELAGECITVASDASETAVGGGVFVPKDNGVFESPGFLTTC